MKSILKRFFPARIRKALRVLFYNDFEKNAKNKKINTFESLRKKAIDGTTFELSKSMLTGFKYMIYHKAFSGNEDMHYQDYEIKGAVACTAAEANLLYNACKFAQPKHPLEIGSYIGWSSAHIASALNGVKLTCVDPFLEVDDGTLHLVKSTTAENRFKENITNSNLINKVELVSEKSPDILSSIAPKEGWDWVFIDGWHLDGQPLKDLKGVLPHISKNAVLFFHDLYVPDVRDAVAYLITNNWEMHVFDTSNYLAICWKGETPEWINALIKLSQEESYTLPSAKQSKYYKGLTESTLLSLKAAYNN